MSSVTKGGGGIKMKHSANVALMGPTSGWKKNY